MKKHLIVSIKVAKCGFFSPHLSSSNYQYAEARVTSSDLDLTECFCFLNPLPNENKFNYSKLKEFADDNFKFDENGRWFSIRIENTMGKGEIARYEQFLLSRTVFSKDLHC